MTFATCPLYPRKRTRVRKVSASALGHKRTLFADRANKIPRRFGRGFVWIRGLISSGSDSRSLPLPAPAKQTHRAEAGGEKWKSSGKRGGWSKRRGRQCFLTGHQLHISVSVDARTGEIKFRKLKTTTVRCYESPVKNIAFER
jgi:hypothetical protein